MTQYLILRRVIVLPQRQVHEPGVFVALSLSGESERRLIEQGCIKRIERKRIRPLAEVMENDSNHRRD